MDARERFQLVLSGRMPPDRLPMVEYAPWWDATARRWESEGLPHGLQSGQLEQYFGLDETHLVYCTPSIPAAKRHGAPVIENEGDYERIVKEGGIYSDSIIERALIEIKTLSPRHASGEIIVNVFLAGFFWHPRTLFGIEPHLCAFYDFPDLMRQMNEDLCSFNMRALCAILDAMQPDLMGYCEDMAYNHGPMASRECFDGFMLPYYRPLIKTAREHGLKTIFDCDGDITSMIPWIINAGIDGAYPLERQANVDIAQIRRQYPEFVIIGGFDKMAMSKGEEAIRAEFERILPVMRSSYYIPSVDHQTPPGVSLRDYMLYIGIFREYCEKAVK